jgi:hypothetical protein
MTQHAPVRTPFSAASTAADVIAGVGLAGIMAPPAREATADGVELQFATNYLTRRA